MTSSYEAIIYSRPGCMRCRQTARAFARMGIEFQEKTIDDHHEALEVMAQEGWQELPLVEVTTPEGETLRWAGLPVRDLEAMQWLVKHEEVEQ